MLSSGAGGGDIITGAEVLSRGMDGAEDRGGGGGAVTTGGEKVVLVVGAAIVAIVDVSRGADTGAWRGGGPALT